MKKNILIVDDSALMRRVLSDIINETEEYHALYTAANGLEALELLKNHTDIDAIFLDMHMPKMNGVEFMKYIKKQHISCHVIIFSSQATRDGDETLEALALGAIDFIRKPKDIFAERAAFKKSVIRMLQAATGEVEEHLHYVPMEKTSKASVSRKGKKLVALACSTGGPNALQEVIPFLPDNLDAPVIIVQHMPEGFTHSLAKRLDNQSVMKVKEAEHQEPLKKGYVYIAKGGNHLKVETKNNENYIVLSDEDPIYGLRPCANIMYDSLINTDYEEIICVVLTGMGADGTLGIQHLDEHKNIYVIAQDAKTSVVYGMPNMVAKAGLTDVICPLQDIAKAITNKVGVR